MEPLVPNAGKSVASTITALDVCPNVTALPMRRRYL